MVEDKETREIITDDNKTSFIETSLDIIKKGTYIVGCLWIGILVSKIGIDIYFGGEVDTSFLEGSWNTLTPVFVGFVTTMLGWFIRDRAGNPE